MCVRVLERRDRAPPRVTRAPGVCYGVRPSGDVEPLKVPT